MRGPQRFLAFSVVLILLLTALPIAGAQHAGQGSIEPALRERFAAEGRADFIVHFTEQADLSPAYTMGWQERGEFVVKALTATAERSQAHAKALLDAHGLRYQTFIAGNELYVWAGDLAVAQSLAALPEVDLVRATRTYYVDPIIDAGVPSTPTGTDALAWGITYTHADQFWTAFGMQGEGIVVANIDTGVQWNHPALDQAFKCGANPSDPACWADPSNICGGSACDNNGHGTHTMGTMVGDDDPSLTWQAGMAPGAQWIACKGCESTSCSEYALSTCADWILAPGGDPANRPHVVNNSWGGAGCNAWYLAKIVAWLAVGVFPAFSVGSSGSGCGTLGSPGDYQESFGSAAHDSSGNIASFSSRGPSCFGSSPYCKPNIIAPGVQICSSIPTDNWSCGYSGTSMASPHSAGAVALLWSCAPGLVGQVDATFEALQDAAGPPGADNCSGSPGCGDVGCNCSYGYGYLDVYAAGLLWCAGAQVGHLDGHVYDAGTGDPIEGATVTASPEYGTLATTDPTGYYTMTLPAGIYSVTASKTGYAPETVPVVVVGGALTTQDFALTWQGGWVSMAATPFEYNRFDCVYYDDGTGFAAYNQKVYCMGGRTGSATEDPSIWLYDPISDSWADTGADMYEDVSNYTADILCDENCANAGPGIYVIGGSDTDGGGGRVRYVQRWYPKLGGTAELVSSDPWPGTAGNQATIPGACVSTPDRSKIYCFGGFQSAAPPYNTAETYEYDPTRPAGNRWQQVATANLSIARGYIYGAAQGHYLYAIGGDTYDGTDLAPVATSERLDLLNLAAGWKPLADMPVPLGEGRGFGLEADTLLSTGKLYIAGGGDWPLVSAEAMEYDIATDTWNQGFADLNVARRNHAGVYIPLCTPDPTDAMPALMVIGGRSGSDDPPFAVPEYYPLPCDWPVPPSSCSLFDASTHVESPGPLGLDPDRLHWGSTDFQALNLSLESRSFVAHFFAPTGEEIEQQTFTLPAGASHLGGLPNHPTFVGTLVLETDGLGMGGVVHLETGLPEDGSTVFPGQADVNLGPLGYVPIDVCTLLHIHNLSPDTVANMAHYVYDQDGGLVVIYPAQIPPQGMLTIDPVGDAGLPIQFIGQGVVVADQLIQVTVQSRCMGLSGYVAPAYCDTALYIPEVPPPPGGMILIHNPNDTPVYGEIWYATGLTQTFSMGPWGGVVLMPLDSSGPAVIRADGAPVVATVRFTDQEGTFAYRAIAAAEARRAAALPVLFSGDQGWQTGNNLWVWNIGSGSTLVTMRIANVLNDEPLWFTATVGAGQVWRPALPPLDGGRGAAILWSDPPQPIVALAGAYNYNPAEAPADRHIRYTGRGFDLDYVKVWGGTFTATVNGAVVTFQGNVAGGSEPIDFAWDFGDGEHGSGQIAVHVYGAPGTYTVHMVASNVWGAYSTAYSDDVTVEQGAEYRVYLPLVFAVYVP